MNLNSSCDTGAHSESVAPPEIRMMFWNTRSLALRVEELEVILKNLDILVCVETWFDNTIQCKVAGFNVFRKDRRSGRGGGVAIFVRKGIEYVNLEVQNPHESIEMCGIGLKNLKPSFDLVVCYRAPDFVLPQGLWNRLVQVASTNRNKNCLFLGDFNAHHRVWNCENNDSNGERFLLAIEEGSLHLHNIDTFTHISTETKKKSNIDLLLSSSEIADKIHYEGIQETWGSDHFPLLININAEKEFYAKKSFKLHSVKTKWEDVILDLDQKYVEFQTPEYDTWSPSQKYDFFTSAIAASIRKHTPKPKKVSQKLHRNPVPWWEKECDRIIRRRKAAFKKWEHTGDLTDLIMYKELAAEVKCLFRKKKMHCFKEFAKTIDARTNITYTWKKCKIFKDKWIKVNPDSIHQNNPTEAAKEALEEACQSSAPTDPSIMPKCKINQFFDIPFSLNELNAIINTRKVSSAPGMDGFTFDVIKKLPFRYRLLLIDIYNEMYQRSDFPNVWLNTFLHFIKKSDGKTVRPLALTSCFCKLFEGMVKMRLDWWLEAHNLIPKSQTGFRKGRSCVDNISSFSIFVEEGFAAKKDTLAAFLDVKGAFLNVNAQILLERVASVGCSEKLVKFVKFLTYVRKIYSSVNADECRLLYKGVPIGGVLSPTLYTVYVADIEKNLPEGVGISQ